jgi:hypothetical protein
VWKKEKRKLEHLNSTGKMSRSIGTEGYQKHKGKINTVFSGR